MSLIRAFKEHAKTDIFAKKVISAENIIAKYKEKRCYVAVSGGKDSLVLLHLAIQIIPNIIVFHWDHGKYLMPRRIERDIISCIRNIISKFGEDPNTQLCVLTSPKLNTPRARWDYKIWYKAFYGKLSSWTKKMKLEVGFLGLRAEESISRRHRTSRITEKKDRILLVYPLHNWTWMDVWAYIFHNNIRFPKIYWKLAKICGWDKARLVTFFDKEFENFGNIEISKFLMPDQTTQ